jgi:hypothetical protein
MTCARADDSGHEARLGYLPTRMKNLPQWLFGKSTQAGSKRLGESDCFILTADYPRNIASYNMLA